MSQYGAQGAAIQGLTYGQIVAFYYPGTALATASGSIRVLLTADTDNDVRVVPVERAAGARGEHRHGVHPAGVRGHHDLAAAEHGERGDRPRLLRRHLARLPARRQAAGRRRRVLPGGQPVPARGRRRPRLSRRSAADQHEHRERGRPRRLHQGRRAARDAGLLAGRRPCARRPWPRGRTPRSIAPPTPTRYYDTCDTTSCQVYGGRSDEDARSNAAVDATAGRVLHYQGKPAFTQFSSSSGGWLLAGSQPYLVAKYDKYDNFSGNPMHTWNTTLTRGAIQNAYPSLGTLRRVLVTPARRPRRVGRPGREDEAGRVEERRVPDRRRLPLEVRHCGRAGSTSARAAWGQSRCWCRCAAVASAHGRCRGRTPGRAGVAAQLRGVHRRPLEAQGAPARLRRLLARRDRDGLRLSEDRARRADRLGPRDLLPAADLGPSLPVGVRAAATVGGGGDARAGDRRVADVRAEDAAGPSRAAGPGASRPGLPWMPESGASCGRSCIPTCTGRTATATSVAAPRCWPTCVMCRRPNLPSTWRSGTARSTAGRAHARQQRTSRSLRLAAGGCRAPAREGDPRTRFEAGHRTVPPCPRAPRQPESLAQQLLDAQVAYHLARLHRGSARGPRCPCSPTSCSLRRGEHRIEDLVDRDPTRRSWRLARHRSRSAAVSGHRRARHHGRVRRPGRAVPVR